MGLMGARVRRVVDPLLALRRIAPLLWAVRDDPALRPILRSSIGWLPLCLLSEPGRWRRQVIRRRDQPEERPGSLYMPHLRASPFPRPDANARLLEEAVATIRAECEQVVRDGGSDGGATFPLVQAGRAVAANTARMPATWDVVQRCPLAQGAGGEAHVRIVPPGTHIAAHHGPSNLRHRHHLTLAGAEGARIRAGNEWRSWAQDRCLVVDDSFEHEVVHEGERALVVLVVDCWHPDLSHLERDFVTRVHQLWLDGVDAPLAKGTASGRRAAPWPTLVAG